MNNSNLPPGVTMADVDPPEHRAQQEWDDFEDIYDYFVLSIGEVENDIRRLQRMRPEVDWLEALILTQKVKTLVEELRLGVMTSLL